MSYDDKMAAACQIITQHNDCAPESAKLDWEKIKAAIIAMGGSTEAALEAASWEDLQDCGVPKVLARLMASTFRKPEVQTGPKTVSAKKAASQTYEELFANYDPTGELNPAVYSRLESLAGDNPVVIFLDGNQKADADRSAQRLREIKDGYQPKEEVVIDGKVRRVYRIGESPSVFVYENPFYPGEMLRPGHICDTTERSLENVPHTVRQIIHLAVKSTHEIGIDRPADVHDVLDYVEGRPLDSIKARYPKAASLLQELEEAGNAPSLRMRQGKKARAQKGDPFYGGHKRF